MTSKQQPKAIQVQTGKPEERSRAAEHGGGRRAR